MWPYPQETADLVTFAEEILNGKLHFLRSVAFFVKRFILDIWLGSENTSEVRCTCYSL